MIDFGTDIRPWEEDESPYKKIAGILKDHGVASSRIGAGGGFQHSSAVVEALRNCPFTGNRLGGRSLFCFEVRRSFLNHKGREWIMTLLGQQTGRILLPDPLLGFFRFGAVGLFKPITDFGLRRSLTRAMVMV